MTERTKAARGGRREGLDKPGAIGCSRARAEGDAIPTLLERARGLETLRAWTIHVAQNMFGTPNGIFLRCDRSEGESVDGSRLRTFVRARGLRA
jgi:hypothetical protein